MGLVKNKNFYKVFFTLTLTIALRNIIVFSVNLADSIMLGQYSENALSGVALVNQIQFLLQLLIMGACEGAQIFISRAWGCKDEVTIRKMVNISLKVSLLIGSGVALVVALFPGQVLGLLSNEKLIVTEGVKYLYIIFWSYPFFAITSSLIVSLNGVETVKLGFYTSILTLCTNVFFNYCLIYGNFSFPEMGARGAAIATLISRILECTAVICYVKFYDKKIKLKIKDMGWVDKLLFKEYLKKGLFVFFSSASWGLAMSMQLSILGHMGASAVTANSIANTTFQIVTVITYASASATGVIIGKTIGEGKSDLVKSYAKTLQVLYLGIGLFTGTVLFFAKDVIINLYDVSSSSRMLALQFMTVLSLTVIGTSYQMPCLTGVVRAGGDTSFVFKNDMIFMWCLVLPVSFLCAFYFRLPPLFVFMCLKSDQILKCFVAVIKVNRFRWIKNITKDATEAKKAV